MPMYRSWPVVPRPFDDEAFGSWFGRIAARYRIRVDELASAAGVSLDHEGLWLGKLPPQGQEPQRQAMLCRLPARVIDAMAPQTLVVSRRVWYCYPCLDLNQQVRISEERDRCFRHRDRRFRERDRSFRWRDRGLFFGLLKEAGPRRRSVLTLRMNPPAGHSLAPFEGQARCHSNAWTYA